MDRFDNRAGAVMQTLIALVFLAIAAPAHGAAAAAPFPALQEKCVEVGVVTLGERGRWSHCAVTHARWMATVDLIDQYQVHYCLSRRAAGCERRALLVFGNRAYTPHAKLLILRMDPGSAEYEEPLLVKTEYGRLLALAVALPERRREIAYHVWRGGRWRPVDGQGWLRQLSAKLPRGLRPLPGTVWPDIDRMAAEVPLQREQSTEHGETAHVELALRNDRFVVRGVIVQPPPVEQHRPAIRLVRDAQ